MKKIETLAEYSQLASRTCPDLGTPILNMVHMNLGIITEIGEALDPIKKKIAYNKQLDVVNVGEEIADCAWYIVNRARLFLPQDVFQNIYSTQEEFDKALTGFNQQFVNGEFDTIKNIAELITSVFPQTDIRNTSNLEAFVGIPDLVLLYKTAEFFKLDFWQILTNNIEKLQIRYPEKFTEEAALNRNLDAEREVLEKE